MPVTKSAIKKLRKDKKRGLRNNNVRQALKDLIKKAKKNPSKAIISKTFAATDKAAKHNLIPKNKAARIKSSLSKLIKETPKAKTSEVKQKSPKAKK